jgi:hypothetical protein
MDIETMPFIEDSFKGPLVANVFSVVEFQPVNATR